MVSYRSTSRNQIRTPAGAVGDPPDVPGYLATFADDTDNFLGVGGAEYCASAAAMTAIPTSRRFIGKLVYRADLDIVFRYVGTGNTALGSADTTHPWQAFDKPPTPYTPTFANLSGTNSVTGLWGINAGVAWATAEVVSGSGWAITAGADVTCSVPTSILSSFTTGRGLFYKGGLTSNGNLIDLVAFVPGPGVGAAGSFRIRALAQSGTAAGAATSANQMGSVITTGSGDRFDIEAHSPCALVA